MFFFLNEVGRCPVVQGSRPPECPDPPTAECLADDECDGVKKCCVDICGVLSCQDPGML